MGDASDPLFRGGGLLVGEPPFLGAFAEEFHAEDREASAAVEVKGL